MLKILQARLQQYVNHEFPDVQAGYRKDRGTTDQIANIFWIFMAHMAEHLAWQSGPVVQSPFVLGPIQI